ncbi:acyltransferase family protein [Methylocystis parvus]|uniref:Acyltransferase family protein n=1 Tax=Methylocystis parvus TaxID=134 RepID=A0A6B8M1M7_9HYPH|nr:acyltransferase family protein [Methylocystis parvus]QGM98777.1 acyltransferase family protein [Methylocystis parvus]WBK00872.1 acyltransferase family protein [Methylocystis parvus OBBP]
MPWTKATPISRTTERVDWVDYAKGWCIILVVMMHSTLGVEEALDGVTWLHGFIDWARPFRMPDFFLVAGLFLSRTINRPWRDYLDRKVLHFVYFFVLWTLIQGLPKFALADGDPFSILGSLAFAMIEPFGTLWFIYLLPIFFVTTKLLRRTPPEAVLLVAAALQISNLYTGSTVIDEFAGRFVYFYAGYLFAPQVFCLAEKARRNMGRTAVVIGAWAVINGLAVDMGYAALPGVSLMLGFVGAAAVVSTSAMLAQTRALAPLRRLGGQSLAIYLAFFLPMAAARTVLLKTGLVPDGGATALIVTAAGVLVPTFVRTAARGTVFAFLFERPSWMRASPPKDPASPAGAASPESANDGWPMRRICLPSAER